MLYIRSLLFALSMSRTPAELQLVSLSILSKVFEGIIMPLITSVAFRDIPESLSAPWIPLKEIFLPQTSRLKIKTFEVILGNAV